MKKVILLIALVSLVSNVYSQVKNNTVKACSISGYVLDDDPNGLNVRATPDKNGRIVRRLLKGDGDISLDISAASGTGWVKITNAWHGTTEEEFTGTGWVFATLLATGTKGAPNYDSPARLYATPSKKAKILRQIPSESETVILDCSGGWVKVSYQGTSGWLAPENQCGSPFTTCN